MKKYKVKNISGGQLVCTLKDGKTTLRLNNKATETIDEGMMTDHLWGIEKKGLVLISEETSPGVMKHKTTTATTA